MKNAIFTYGSLLNLNERKKLKLSYEAALKANLLGYRRVFNKLPSWRKGAGYNIAVLNIERYEKAAINGLLLIGLDKKSSQLLDERERGYEKVSLSADEIKLEIDAPPPLTGTIYECNITQYCIHSYIAKAENIIRGDGKNYDESEKNKLEPNLDYLKICLDGASELGDDFYKDFISSTYLVNGMRLDDYVS